MHSSGDDMATQTETATAIENATASTLTLEAPAPLQTVTPAQAVGLVPLKEDQKDALEEGDRPVASWLENVTPAMDEEEDPQ